MAFFVLLEKHKLNFTQLFMVIYRQLHYHVIKNYNFYYILTSFFAWAIVILIVNINVVECHNDFYEQFIIAHADNLESSYSNGYEHKPRRINFEEINYGKKNVDVEVDGNATCENCAYNMPVSTPEVSVSTPKVPVLMPEVPVSTPEVSVYLTEEDIRKNLVKPKTLILIDTNFSLEPTTDLEWFQYTINILNKIQTNLLEKKNLNIIQKQCLIDNIIKTDNIFGIIDKDRDKKMIILNCLAELINSKKSSLNLTDKQVVDNCFYFSTIISLSDMPKDEYEKLIISPTKFQDVLKYIKEKYGT